MIRPVDKINSVSQPETLLTYRPSERSAASTLSLIIRIR